MKKVCGNVRNINVEEQPLLIWDKKRGIYIPQPTRFWILDKKFHADISRLEEKGYIKYFSEKITDDEKLFVFFINLHRQEVKKRERILKENYPDLLDYPLTKVLLDKNLGIGGIRNFMNKPFKVKCLHLWTAYHLGDEGFKNPIGQFVLDNI
ncbi:DUF501 domain-containing protein [Persephonella sp.]